MMTIFSGEGLFRPKNNFAGPCQDGGISIK